MNLQLLFPRNLDGIVSPIRLILPRLSGYKLRT